MVEEASAAPAQLDNVISAWLGWAGWAGLAVLGWLVVLLTKLLQFANSPTYKLAAACSWRVGTHCCAQPPACLAPCLLGILGSLYILLGFLVDTRYSVFKRMSPV